MGEGLDTTGGAGEEQFMSLERRRAPESPICEKVQLLVTIKDQKDFLDFENLFFNFLRNFGSLVRRNFL
jgi:hypothetical protein